MDGSDRRAGTISPLGADHPWSGTRRRIVPGCATFVLAGKIWPCQVRFIEVPEELHRRYKHAGNFPPTR